MSRRHLGLSDQAREASNLLAAICGWFTEVFETLRLKKGKAPLEASGKRAGCEPLG